MVNMQEKRIAKEQRSYSLMPGEVALSYQVGRDPMPVTDRSQVGYVLLEAVPTELMAQVRLPLNFSLVLDCSGSMHGSKIASVKEAVKMVIDNLSPDDYISVVTFTGSARTIVSAMPARDPWGMKSFIDTMRAGGGTNMARGMKQGMDELHRWQIPNAINRMILLTDGRTVKSKECRQLAQQAREMGIVIYPLGIGADWDEALLDEIGLLSGGAEAEFIRYPTDAMSIFQQQVQSAMAVSPKRAVKVLPTISDPGPGVLSDRRIVVPLGDLEKNNPPAVLVELLIEPRAAGLFRIAQAELSYDVPIAGLVGEKVREDIKITFRNDAMQSGQVNATVMNFVEKVNAHRLVSKVLDEYKRTGKATTRLAPNVTRVLDAETQAALEQITQGQQISEEQVKSIGNKTRKLTQRLDNVLG